MLTKYWKKETGAGIWLLVQGCGWKNKLLCRSIKNIDGYEYDHENGKYIVSIKETGKNIVEGTFSPIEIHVTIDYHSALGVNCIFNEYYMPGENITKLTDDLYEQNLDELGFTIYDKFVENTTRGMYWSDDENLQEYTEITRQEAETLAILAGYKIMKEDEYGK